MIHASFGSVWGCFGLSPFLLLLLGRQVVLHGGERVVLVLLKVAPHRAHAAAHALRGEVAIIIFLLVPVPVLLARCLGLALLARGPGAVAVAISAVSLACAGSGGCGRMDAGEASRPAPCMRN